jgi:NADH-quinone oxidoreductase subunit I
LKIKADTCIVCELCVKACPVDCIGLEWKREEGKPGKICTKAKIDYQRCMYCGLCVEACPRGGIVHSNEYENSVYDKKKLIVDWVTLKGNV